MKSEYPIKKIEAVINLIQSNRVTAYQVAKQTGARAPEVSLLALCKGKSSIKNITFMTAQAILDWYDKYHEEYI